MDREQKSFLAEMRRRRIVISDMPPDVRIAAACGALMLLLALLLEIARAHLGDDVFVGAVNDAGVSAIVPHGAVIAWVAGEWLIFTLIFAAVLRLRHALAAIGVIVAVFGVAGWLGQATAWGWLILLGPAVLLLGQFAVKRGWLDATGTLVVSAVASTLTMGTMVVLYDTKHDSLLPTAFMILSLVVAVVGLWMAGTDIAEITQVGVEAVTSRLAPLLKTDRRAGLLALLGMAANLAAAWGVVHTMGWMSGKDLHDEAVALISMAVGGMLLWGLVANNKKLQVSAHLSYGSLLLYVAMYMLVMLIFVVGDAMYAMVVQHSLRYDQVDFDVLLDRFAAFLLPLLTMGLFVLFLRHGRRSVKAFRVFGFATCAALFACALFRRDGSSSVLFGHGVVLGSLVLMVLGTRLPWLRHQWRALCRLLFIANVSFAVLQLVALIFRAGPGKVEGQAALSAVIVGMALGWDILTSGDLTNGHSESLPRFSRVAFFTSYIVTVGLLFLLTQTGYLFFLGRAGEPFSSESYVGDGIVYFGAPMVFYVFAVQLRGLRAEAPMVVLDTHSEEPGL